MRRGAAVMDQELEPLVGVLRLLSDKTRLNILLLLAGGERNVGSLCQELALPQPTVSHHLGLLRMQNLLTSRRNGKQVYYGLNDQVNVLPGGSGLEIDVDQFTLKIGKRTSL
jgi:DNA-binding transcriptional ArsR family regulator